MRSSLLLCLVVITTTAFGQTWSPVLSNRAIFSIAANPANEQTLFAGNQARIFFRSYDGGLSWEELSIGSWGGASQLSVMMVHPLDTAVVLAGGIGLDGLARSTDHGASWSTVLKASDQSRFELGGAGALAMDPSAPRTMYAVRYQHGEVYRSTDAGATWELWSTVPGIEAIDHLRALSVSPSDPNVLLVAGRRAHIRRSTDGGRSWDSTDMSGIPYRQDQDVAQFAWSPTQSGVVYATVQRSLHQLTLSGGLWRSTDHGQSWQQWRFVDTSLYAINVYPGYYGDELWIGGNQVDFPSDSGMIKGDSILLRSKDGGTSWTDDGSIPWMEDEIGDLGTNIWGFARVALPSIPEQVVYRHLIATDGGIFARDIATGVDEVPFTSSSAPRAVWSVSGRLKLSDGFHGTHFRVMDLHGQHLQYGIVSVSGEIDCSLLAHGTYVVTFGSAERPRYLLLQR